MIETHPDSPVQTDTVRDQVISLLAVQDTQQFAQSCNVFIDEKVHELSASSTPGDISLLNRIHEGFIHPDSAIKQIAFGRGFRLDDNDIYTSLFITMKEFSEVDGWSDSPHDSQQFRRLALYSTQYALQRYFEGAATDAESIQSRNNLIRGGVDITDEKSFEPRSIADYKGRALCAELAAAANNMLTMLGFETSYIISELKIDDQKPESHAFLLVKNADGDSLIYDPTHPEVTFYEDRMSTKPFLARGGDVLTTEGSVTIPHSNTRIIDGQTTEQTSQYTYSPSLFMAGFKQA
jgi:hypothetical protein